MPLLDATFFEDGEIPRPMSEVPHPYVEESVARFRIAEQIEDKNKIYFIHLNHTNPATRSLTLSRESRCRKSRGIALPILACAFRLE